MPNYGKYYIAVRLLLLKQYLEANAGKNRVVSRKELEAFLEEHDMGVEKKTIYADLAVLGNICGLQLEYDVHKKGYRLLNPPFEPYELRLMVDGVQSSKFITKEKAREITGEIKALAGKDTIESLNRPAYVADRVRSMNDSVVKDADRIHEAINKDLKIGFQYFHYSPNTSNPKTYSKSGNQYIVSPYALLWNNGNYYLYAYDSEKQKFRYFRVDRMERISHPLPYHREGKEKYRAKDITTQKAKVFEMYGGKEYTVRIRFRTPIGGEDTLADIGLFQKFLQFIVRIGLNGGFVCLWQLDFKVGNIPAFHKKPHQRFQISCVGSHRNLIQIGVIPQSNVKLLHYLLIEGGNRGIGRDSLVNLLNGFPIVVDCPLPKVPCFTVQDIFLKTVHESLFPWEAHPHFLHQNTP